MAACRLPILCLMGLPLILMDADNYCRCRYRRLPPVQERRDIPHVPDIPYVPHIPRDRDILCRPSARKNAADSREQGTNAYQQKDGLHIYCYFVISSETPRRL